MKAHFFLQCNCFLTHPAIFPHIFYTVFPKHFFLLSILSSKLSWNTRNLCVKLPLFTPFEVQFIYIFFLKPTSPLSEALYLLRRWNLKDMDEKNHRYFKQGPYKSHFWVKWVGALLFQENGLTITFTWQNEPLCIQVRQGSFQHGYLHGPVRSGCTCLHIHLLLWSHLKVL